MAQSRREREHEELQRLRQERAMQSTVSWEEAIPCPTCGQPREVVKGPFPLENNVTARGFLVMCRNKGRCRQADLPPFFIQRLSSGRVPIMLPGEKQFDIQNLSPEQQAQVDEYYNAQYDSTRRGDELRKE